MAAPKQLRVGSFEDFVAIISKRLEANSQPVWFRGCGRSTYELKPSLYRHPTKTSLVDIRDLEKRAMALFKQRSVPYRSALPSETSWERLFVMQHYGVPTRLLDWTESPFAALFFALSNSVSRNSSPAEDAAVWMFDPLTWNKYALRDVTAEAAILTVDDPDLKSYEPMADSPRSWSNDPVALFGMYNSPRIVAQRGVFTIAGSSLHGMESIFDSDSYPAETLTKMVIPNTRIVTLMTAIIRIGYADSVFFPDLDGLARELRRLMEFNV